MASGSPSSRRQIERTASASSSRRLNWGRARRARSMKSSSASTSLNGGTAQVTSPPTSSGSRLVATTFNAGAASSSPAVASAAESTTCSQLSSTTNAWRPERCPRTAWASVRPDPGSLTPRVVATWSHTKSPPDRGEKSTNQVPSGKSSAAAAARRSARRVLPAPPGPVRVSSRASASRAAAWANSVSRPTKRVSGAGSLVDTVTTWVEP